LRGRRNADAVVVGGGLSGLHIAYWLGKAGLRVILLEAETLGSGASGRAAGLVTQTGGLCYSNIEKFFGLEACQAYTQTQNAAMQSLRELAADRDMDADWRDMDAGVIIGDEKGRELLEKEHSAMTRAGLIASLTEATQCPLPSALSIQLRGQATLQPYQYLRALAHKATKLGVSIHEESRATAAETGIVYTARGSVLAPYLIMATGYPVLNTPGWYFTRLYQRQSHLLPIETPEVFDGIYLDALERFSIRRLREGMIFHQLEGPVGTRLHESPLDLFARDHAREIVGSQFCEAYGGADTHSADGLPYIGAYSAKTPNIFVATGYGHRGILNSVVAAQAISAKILGLPSEGYPIYSGQRRNPRVLRAEVKTAVALAGRYLRSGLRIQAPKCSHMGCKLVYRHRTQTWECPCHGSLFDDIGRVESAPAVRDTPIHRKRKG
jgi:glycine/D-amino acid oxidase-like deaminating enzyme